MLIKVEALVEVNPQDVADLDGDKERQQYVTDAGESIRERLEEIGEAKHLEVRA